MPFAKLLFKKMQNLQTQINAKNISGEVIIATLQPYTTMDELEKILQTENIQLPQLFAIASASEAEQILAWLLHRNLCFPGHTSMPLQEAQDFAQQIVQALPGDANAYKYFCNAQVTVKDYKFGKLAQWKQQAHQYNYDMDCGVVMIGAAHVAIFWLGGNM